MSKQVSKSSPQKDVSITLSSYEGVSWDRIPLSVDVEEVVSKKYTIHNGIFDVTHVDGSDTVQFSPEGFGTGYMVDLNVAEARDLHQAFEALFKTLDLVEEAKHPTNSPKLKSKGKDKKPKAQRKR
jgi:hypothetical protein